MSEQIDAMTNEERENFLKETFVKMLSSGISLATPLQSSIAEYLATGRWKEVGRGFFSTWQETYSNGLYDAFVNGIPIEMPADQYQDFLNALGWNPVAMQRVTKSQYTYKQAKNIAKAGNLDSLIYDVKSNAILSTAIASISFIISYSYYRWNGENADKARRQALHDAICSGGGAMLIGILSAQALRIKAIDKGVRLGVQAVYKTAAGRTLIRKIASSSLGKAGSSLSTKMAVGHVAKMMKSNVVTSCVTTAVITAPDFYRATISKEISWAQFGKNLTVNVAGVAGGAGGWLAGAAAGAAAGTVVPGIGNVIGGIAGGIIGAIGGSTVASAGAKAGLDRLVKDDAKEMLELIQQVFEQLCFDYLLSENEVQKVIKKMGETINEKWLRKMYGCGPDQESRKAWAYESLDTIFAEVAKERDVILLPVQEEIDEALDEVISGLPHDEEENESPAENPETTSP